MSLDKAIADAVRQALAEQLRAPSSADWVPHTEWPFPQKRAAYLARTGAIKARLDKRTWYARRADVDAYLESLPGPKVDGARPLTLGEMAMATAKRSRRRAA